MDTNDARRRRIRTYVQTAVSACAVLLVAVPLLMEYIQPVVQPSTYAMLAAGAVAVTSVAGLVTRFMSAPAVVDFIDRRMPWLSATAPAEAATEVETEAEYVPEHAAPETPDTVEAESQ